MSIETNLFLLLTPKTQLAYLDDSMSIRQVLEKMKAHGYQTIPLISSATGEYLGSVSEGDLLWYIVNQREFDLKECENINVLQIVRPNFMPAVNCNTSIDEVTRTVMSQNYVPVVDDRNILMGIVTRRSVLTHLLQEQAQ